MKAPPLGVSGTATLQATLEARNQVLQEEAGLWAKLTLHKPNVARIREAQGAVKLAFQEFVKSDPPGQEGVGRSPQIVDLVKAWMINNAQRPDLLIGRLNAPY